MTPRDWMMSTTRSKIITTRCRKLLRAAICASTSKTALHILVTELPQNDASQSTSLAWHSSAIISHHNRQHPLFRILRYQSAMQQCICITCIYNKLIRNSCREIARRFILLRNVFAHNSHPEDQLSRYKCLRYGLCYVLYQIKFLSWFEWPSIEPRIEPMNIYYSTVVW